MWYTVGVENNKKIEMSNRLKNSKRNKHVITYFWRNDPEDMRTWNFPTKEAAWAHVVGEIRKRIKCFEPEETVRDHGKTIVDWEEVFTDLFNGGAARVVYCQCSCWYDNWGYFKKD